VPVSRTIAAADYTGHTPTATTIRGWRRTSIATDRGAVGRLRAAAIRIGFGGVGVYPVWNTPACTSIFAAATHGPNRGVISWRKGKYHPLTANELTLISLQGDSQTSGLLWPNKEVKREDGGGHPQESRDNLRDRLIVMGLGLAAYNRLTQGAAGSYTEAIGLIFHGSSALSAQKQAGRGPGVTMFYLLGRAARKSTGDPEAPLPGPTPEEEHSRA